MKSTFTTIALATALSTCAGVALAAPSTFAVDPNHSWVQTESRHFGVSVVGAHIQAKGGSITIDPEAKTGSATIAMNMSTINSGVDKLTDEMKAADYFNIAQYPEATFTAKQFTFNGTDVATISGELSIKGRSNPLTLTATNYKCITNPMSKKYVCGGSFEGTIQRSLFDVSKVIPFVADETKLHIQIEAAKTE
jgi:polyisoprenoid-binding protein YceI